MLLQIIFSWYGQASKQPARISNCCCRDILASFRACLIGYRASSIAAAQTPTTGGWRNKNSVIAVSVLWIVFACFTYKFLHAIRISHTKKCGVFNWQRKKCHFAEKNSSRLYIATNIASTRSIWSHSLTKIKTKLTILTAVIYLQKSGPIGRPSSICQ